MDSDTTAAGDFAINEIVLHKTPLQQPTPVTTSPGLPYIMVVKVGEEWLC